MNLGTKLYTLAIFVMPLVFAVVAISAAVSPRFRQRISKRNLDENQKSKPAFFYIFAICSILFIIFNLYQLSQGEFRLKGDPKKYGLNDLLN